MNPPTTPAPALPLVLDNQHVPAFIRVFEDNYVAAWHVATLSAEAAIIKDDRDLELANSVAVQLSTAIKFIDKRDEDLRRPLKQTMDAVRQVTDHVREPIERAKKALVNKIAIFDRDRKAAQERLRVEAQERHAAELKRLADEKATTARAAQEKADKDARELAEMLGETLPAAVPLDPLPKGDTIAADTKKAEDFASKLFAQPATLPAPNAEIDANLAKSTVATSATIKRVPKLRITDFSKIPYKIGDEILMQPVESAIMRVLKAGAKIEGAEIVYEEQASMKPQREPDPHFS